MAHTRSSKKDIRKNQRRRAHNKAAQSAMRTEIKKVRRAVQGGDAQGATAALPYAQKLLDKAARKNRMHPNRAARLKSRLAKRVARMGKGS